MHPLLISDVVSNYTQLSEVTKSGKRFGKCPFCHSESNAFSVDVKQNIFFCYACGEGGSAKDFYVLKHGWPKMKPEKKDPLLLSIYEAAARFYYQMLVSDSNPGRRYFVGRGIRVNTATRFGLGYAPDCHAALYKMLSKTYNQEDIFRSGLVRKNDKGEIYDFFRNRVMFPVFDNNGDVVAFGGRTLNEKYGPKYINSAESEIFSKRKNLYGYPYCAENRGRRLIICEGYMDLITIQEAGFLDSAAVLGTALTEEHARIIASDYKEVCLSLDSDKAGVHAAKQSISILKRHGLTITVPDYAPFKDPDEFIRKAGVRAFQERLDRALPAEVFLARNSVDNISELTDIMVEYFENSEKKDDIRRVG